MTDRGHPQRAGDGVGVEAASSHWCPWAQHQGPAARASGTGACINPGILPYPTPPSAPLRPAATQTQVQRHFNR